jgi:excisionase family DNA binding protein
MAQLAFEQKSPRVKVKARSTLDERSEQKAPSANRLRVRGASSNDKSQVSKLYRARRKARTSGSTSEAEEAASVALLLRHMLAARPMKKVTIDRDDAVRVVAILERIKTTALPLAQQSPPRDSDEVTPQQAAGILQMSRPSVMRLVQQGHLSARKVGAHHKLSAAEVKDYARRHARKRATARDELSTLSQELGI